LQLSLTFYTRFFLSFRISELIISFNKYYKVVRQINIANITMLSLIEDKNISYIYIIAEKVSITLTIYIINIMNSRLTNNIYC